MNYHSTLANPQQQRIPHLQPTLLHPSSSFAINGEKPTKKKSSTHTNKQKPSLYNTQDLSPRGTITTISRQIDNHVATTGNISINNLNNVLSALNNFMTLSSEEQLHEKYSALLMVVKPHLQYCNNTKLFKELYKENNYFQQAINHFSAVVYEKDFKTVTGKSLTTLINLHLTTTVPQLKCLPERLKCYIKHKAYKRIQKSHYYTYANSEGIDCYSFCPKTSMIAIGDKQFGLLLRSLSIVCNKTLTKHTPKSIAFNHDGSRIAALIGNLKNNISMIYEWDTQSYKQTNGLAIENNCHYISYYKYPHHMLRVIADNTDNKHKTYIQYHVSLFDECQPVVKKLPGSEYTKTTQWNDMNCKQHYDKHYNIHVAYDINQTVTEVVFKKHNARHFYLCDQAIKNSTNINDLLAITNTCAYKTLTDYENNIIDKKIEEKNAKINKKS